MRITATIVFFLCLALCGCYNNDAASQSESRQGDLEHKGNTHEQDSSVEKNICVIETPEIVRILEEEDIEDIDTCEDQVIGIRLKDGRVYEGTYVHKQAGKYADNKKLFDILNLVLHIQEKRQKHWAISCE